jgi:formiminoglutamase
MNIRRYLLPKQSTWHGRIDALEDDYLFQQIQLLKLTRAPKLEDKKPGIALLGFHSDIGVKRNLGRIGARKGADAIKQALGSLPLQKKQTIYDAGSIVCTDDFLEAAQENLGNKIHLLLQHRFFPIVLGGGHETAWGHYQGIAKFLKEKDIAIVNLDAHFDLRPIIDNRYGSSGTSFRQIADHRQKAGLDFHYYCFGIQTTANTKGGFKIAKDLKVKHVLANDMHQDMQPALALIQKIIKKHKHVYLTVCLDVFASHLAPGVSAPQVNGITLQQALQLITPLSQSKKLISADIAEYAPSYDIDHRTAKLAVQLVDRLLVGQKR